MSLVNPTFEDGRGNRLVYRPSPLQQPKLKAAPAEAPPPPRERTLIVPLEALNTEPRESAPPDAPAPAAPKVQQPPARAQKSGFWGYAALALVILLAIAILLF